MSLNIGKPPPFNDMYFDYTIDFKTSESVVKTKKLFFRQMDNKRDVCSPVCHFWDLSCLET